MNACSEPFKRHEIRGKCERRIDGHATRGCVKKIRLLMIV